MKQANSPSKNCSSQFPYHKRTLTWAPSNYLHAQSIDRSNLSNQSLSSLLQDPGFSTYKEVQVTPVLHRNPPLTQILLSQGYQVLYLDQRSTDLSTPVTPETLALKGSPAQQAGYLLNFRADTIVEDCEAVRRVLVPEDEDVAVDRRIERNKAGK